MSELDRLIAEKVMGWKRIEPIYPSNPAFYEGSEGFKMKTEFKFKPSTNITDAFLVVERLRDMGYSVSFHSDIPDWQVIIWAHDDLRVNAATLPLAICEAAIKLGNSTP